MGRIAMLILAASMLAACSNAAVSKAVGTAGDQAAPILVDVSSTAITVSNHAGRPLLDVRITLEMPGTQPPFVGVIPTIDTGAMASLALDTFRTEDGSVFGSAVGPPRQVMVTARDTLANAYHTLIPWKQ